MTPLSIIPNYEKKRLKCYGTVAAGEHVAVTVMGGAAWIGEGSALRLRVLFGQGCVGVFPPPVADGETAPEWQPSGPGEADAYCELNLNTLQAAKWLKCGGACLWVLDDIENSTLYATGEFDVLAWPKRRGIDEPIDLDGYPDLVADIAQLKADWEAYKQEIVERLAAKQDAIADLSAIRSGASAGASAVQPGQLSAYVNAASYDSGAKKILLKHDATTVAEVDATAFIKDGMVSSVAVTGGNLVITFNTDSGKEPISIPLTSFFDASNYYDKTAADGRFVQKETGKGLSSNDYTTTEKQKLAGVEAGAQVNAVASVNGKTGVVSLGAADVGAVPASGGTMTGTLTVPNLTFEYGGKQYQLAYALGSFRLLNLTDGYGLTFPSIQNGIATFALLQNLADNFSTSETYAVNNLCVHGDTLYRCETAVTTAGAWTDSTNWTKATVDDVLATLRAAVATKAPLDSPAFTGTPTAPTVQDASDSTAKVATTAFVQAAIQAGGGGGGGGIPNYVLYIDAQTGNICYNTPDVESESQING